MTDMVVVLAPMSKLYVVLLLFIVLKNLEEYSLVVQTSRLVGAYCLKDVLAGRS